MAVFCACGDYARKAARRGLTGRCDAMCGTETYQPFCILTWYVRPANERAWNSGIDRRRSSKEKTSVVRTVEMVSTMSSRTFTRRNNGQAWMVGR